VGKHSRFFEAESDLCSPPLFGCLALIIRHCGYNAKDMGRYLVFDFGNVSICGHEIFIANISFQYLQINLKIVERRKKAL
jgi:hypothetical protein